MGIGKGPLVVVARILLHKSTAGEEILHWGHP